MTITNENTVSGPYLGNGVTTTFARTFPVRAESDLKVVQIRDGIETTLTTGFTIEDADQPSGNVVFATPPPIGDTLYLVRETPLLQETDYNTQGAVTTEQVERDLDTLVMQQQDTAERIERTLKVTRAAPALQDLPVPDAGKILVANATGDGWENGPDALAVTGLNDAVAAADAATVAASAAQQAADDALAVAGSVNLPASPATGAYLQWNGSAWDASLAFDAQTLAGAAPGYYLDAGNLTGTVPAGRLSGNYAINITGSADHATSADTATSADNADTLDGQHGSYYRDAANLNTGRVPTSRLSGTYNISISGTASPNVYAGSSNGNTNYPVGSVLLVSPAAVATPSRNASVTLRISFLGNATYATTGSGSVLSGTWRTRGATLEGDGAKFLAQRIA